MPIFNGTLVGRTYGRLTVIAKGVRTGRTTPWVCRCECGTIKEFAHGNLTYGHTQSCGCLMRERITETHRTHGRTVGRIVDPLYSKWITMKQRCNDPACRCYPHYGGRGIKVCERWSKSFEDFAADMGPKPNPKSTIERIDNDGPYEPGNCRWASLIEQSRNRRSSKRLTFEGRTLTQAEWAEITGLSQKVIWYRLHAGWSVEKTLTTPIAR